MAIKSICTRSIDTIKMKREKKEISIYKIYNFVNVFFPNEESSNTTSQYRKFPPKSTLTINNLNNLTTISWSFTRLKRLSIRTFSPYPRLFHFPYSRLDKSSIRRKKGDDAITGNRCRRKWHGGRVGVSHRVFSCSSHVRPAVVTPAKQPGGRHPYPFHCIACCFI